MQIAYFADPLYQTPTAGGARYTVELARELARMPEIDLRLLTLYSPEEVAARVQEKQYPFAVSLAMPLSRRAQYLLWHTGLSGSMAQAAASADVLHTPILIVPPKRRTPLAVTVFDLTFVTFPQHHLRTTKLLLGSGLRRAVRTADVFLAISESTKRDLVRLTGVSPSRIKVTPLAADPLFRPVKDSGALARLGIDRPFVLYVGTLEPRKNVAALLRAFAALKNTKDTETLLVLAGAKGWMYEQIFALIAELGITEQVRMLGYVENDDLPVLYTEAQVFVYPSLFEGFGLPVLEAMQCGAPVITTDVSSLPEVAGDAALLISPEDTAGLVAALSRVLSEPALREDLRGASLAQAARFSWRKTAEMTVEAYDSVQRRRS